MAARMKDHLSWDRPTLSTHAEIRSGHLCSLKLFVGPGIDGEALRSTTATTSRGCLGGSSDGSSRCGASPFVVIILEKVVAKGPSKDFNEGLTNKLFEVLLLVDVLALEQCVTDHDGW